MSVQYTGGYHEYSGGYHEYTGGVQYTGGYNEDTRGYHDKCGGRSLGKQLNCMETPVYWTSLDVLLISPQCTEHPPVYSIISPSTLNISRCTQWYPPSVLNISWCTAQTLCRVGGKATMNLSGIRSCREDLGRSVRYYIKGIFMKIYQNISSKKALY